MTSPYEISDRAEDAIGRRLRVAAAVARCPLAALYRIDGDRAHLVAAHLPSRLFGTLGEELPAWRFSREQTTFVPVIGRGPAAPESVALPASFGAGALISAPVRARDVRAVLLLADSAPRMDLATIDPVALATVCELLADALVARDELENTGVRRSDPVLPALRPSDPFELAAWPADPPGHDPVTGLPERRVLLRSMEDALAAAAVTGRGVAVALLALDRFQRIDDWLGRNVGDEVLRQVAERVLDTTTEDDLVGRGSGDEFIVVITGVGRGGRSAGAVADRLLQAIREPFHVQGYDLSLSATIGLSRFPEDATDPATLLRYAGIALHRAKGRRRGRLERFTPELKEAVEQRGEIERRLRRALGAGELMLHYQPKVALRDRRTTGVEALIRWQRGDALVAPGQFLPVAEESELIVPIGTWALHEACRQMRRWRDRGVPLESVAVNVSALQFARPDFVGTVARTLESARLEPRHLELEVTETSLMDDVDAAAERLAALRRLGVRVSVDDFGTGYSSLAYLQRLPVDVLKIDRSFVKDLDAPGPAREHARALAQAITGLGHHLGLRVLAEGVETREQLDALEALGCDEVQGFLFSRPLPPEQVESALR
ncbi:MAG TPA: bifunctional diguanylate cyclase/phosphodiesterase [Sandaracinaceae bacterium]